MESKESFDMEHPLYELVCKYRLDCFDEECEKVLKNYALEQLFRKLDGIDNAKAFEKMYRRLKDNILEDMGAYEMKQEDFFSEYIWICCDSMKNTDSSGEYLIYKRHHPSFRKKKESLIAELNKRTKGETVKIALYGGGKNGKKAFWLLMNQQKYRICAWVDRDFEKLGYPLMSPQKLEKNDFDYVLIEIENEIIADEVAQILKAMGIKGEKILWWRDIQRYE